MSDLFVKSVAFRVPPRGLSLRREKKKVPRLVFAVKHERLFSYVSNRHK